MKKTLLILFAVFSSFCLWAQSKSTGVVTLGAGMTAKLDLNNANTTATLTLTGSSDRWFALQFGSFGTGQGMANGQDMVYYNGTTLIDGHMVGVGNTPQTDTNNWTVTSNTVSGTTRTIVATRAFAGGTNDFTFSYSDTTIDFAYARCANASFVFSNHGGNRGYALNKVFNCEPPANPTANAQTFCQGATVNNLAASGGTGAEFNWYLTATGGTELSLNTVLTTGTYYVSQTISDCESNRVAVTVTVNTVNAPTASAQTFCNAATVANLQATGASGATINWYNVAAGGTALSSGTSLSTGTYYVEQTVGTCTSTRTSVSVQITVMGTPTAEDQEVCAGNGVWAIDVTISGEGFFFPVFYDTPTGGEPLDLDYVLETGTYYVSQSDGVCEGVRDAVVITVKPLPDTPTGNTTQQFETGDTIADLEITTVEGAVITWYVMQDINFILANESDMLQDGVTYYATQTIDGCESEYLAITADEVLANQAFSIKGFALYPNPVKDVITISAAESISGVNIYNLLGQEIMARQINNTTAEISVVKLPAGNYIVKATAVDGSTATVKIIKF
ncbi:Ig-like domain-containing protein [Flavobacterium rhizosphaerae]|uniref:T9SS type A sorting domain-containing protein n=1 Tax=Flavobacterium rhizosphaerae TaxID=3163298 RepID=A0ABW8YXP0_9FLAO